MKAFAVFCVFLVVSCVAGLNEDATKEKKCFTPPSKEDVGLDVNWFSNVDRYYVPLWNQFYATRTATDLLSRDPKFIAFHEVQPSACLFMGKDNVLSAFGRAIQLNVTGDTSSINFKAPWSGAKSAKFQFHKTDNKNYILGIGCWEDGEAGWAVLSNKPLLDAKIRSEVLKYVKSIGFDEKKAVDEDYALCHGRYATLLRQPALFPVVVPLVRQPYVYYSTYKK